jgi:hypothetical protein
MKKLIPLFVLLSVPAMVHASTVWPVQASGSACSMVNAAAGEAGNPLTVTYDSASGDVILTIETSDIASGLNDSGSLELAMVFLDNGELKHDDGWGARSFGYTREGEVTRFTTRFAGERPVRQILADLAASKHVGLLYRGQVVSSTNLAGAASSIGELRACARRAVAAN